VHLTRGQFNVTAAIEMKSNIVLEGEGAETVIEKNCADYAIESVGSLGSEKENVVLISFKITSIDTETDAVIYMYYTDNLIINNIIIDTLITPRYLMYIYKCKSFSIANNINYREDFIIEDSLSTTNPENAKGVFKINSGSIVFAGSDSIKPIGLKFKFTGDVLDGNSKVGVPGLKALTKGFFIVRQQRIPTLLTQGVSIATSEKAFTPTIQGTFDYSGGVINTYFSESFLKSSTYTIQPRAVLE
jgi:hypothetical protein